MLRTGLSKKRARELIMMQYAFNVAGLNMAFYTEGDQLHYDVLMSRTAQALRLTGVPIELWTKEMHEEVESSEMILMARISETFMVEESSPQFKRHLELNFGPEDAPLMQEILPGLFAQLLRLPLESAGSIVSLFGDDEIESDVVSIRADIDGSVNITTSDGDISSMSEYLVNRSMSSEGADETDGTRPDETDETDVAPMVEALDLNAMD